MSMCSICGSLEQWHRTKGGGLGEPYCHKCEPRETKILPLDMGKDIDIDEGEIHGHGMPAPPAMPAVSVGNDPDVGWVQPNASSISFDVADAPSNFEIIGPGGKPTTLSIDGALVITAYDKLPKTAKQGQMGCIKGEDVIYVFDSVEWQNLGEALLGKKRNVLTPKDEKIDRRAAIAATKAKDEE